MQFFFLVLCFFSVHPLFGQEKPYTILIVGGGPAGLAAAIEAQGAKAQVIVVEKREHYSRERFVLLTEHSLNLLKRWKVEVPELNTWELFGSKIGFTKIRHLEDGLAERVHALGISKILGAFQGMRDGIALIAQGDKKVEIPYDLLVGADGVESAVRYHLKIHARILGEAEGSVALIPTEDQALDMNDVVPFKHGLVFINRIKIPSFTLISAQAKKLSKELLLATLTQLGWSEEAKQIASGAARYLDHIPILLQQADRVVDRKRAAILLGDAAATASFLQGMGANFALETARIAGEFFKSERKNWKAFKLSMQEAANHLLADSAFLFTE